VKVSAGAAKIFSPAADNGDGDGDGVAIVVDVSADIRIAANPNEREALTDRQKLKSQDVRRSDLKLMV